MDSGTTVILASVAAATLRQTAPLALAGLGGILSERVGVINIALEGMMLLGSFTGMWVGRTYGLAVGLAAAVVSGVLLGLLHLTLTQRFRMNHVISGVAINILCLNSTTYLLRRYFTQAEPQVEAKLAGAFPVELFIGATLVLLVFAHVFLYRTPYGLRLRAVGESAESARMAGIAPAPIRLIGVLASGALAATAGAYLSMAVLGRFSEDMVSGRGFIALAAVICGRWKPLGTGLAALAFGFFDALQLQIQGKIPIPGEFVRMLPYVFTILAAVAFRSAPPAGLGKEEPAR